MSTPTLSGQFLYRSFYNGSIDISDGRVVGTPAIAEPWTPVGVLDVQTDMNMGDVIGTLTFRPGVVLQITGKISPAADPLPASVELKGEGLGAVYQIKGWFVPDSDHLVGTVLCLVSDLAKQPVGTAGPFILFPKRKDQQEALTDAVLAASLQEQKMKGPNLRQLHSKSHGLVSGKFTIEENIPERCKVGVFAKPQEYDLWIRFSNASSPKAFNELKPDTEGDVRGMAIKLKSIEGSQVTSDETGTQDFVLINHHIFFLPDVQGYIDLGEFRKATAQKISPDPDLAQKLAPSLAIVREMNNKVIGNPLCIQYWSTTPYKLGSHFIKFSVKPHELEVTPSSIPDSPDYLREAMVEQITKEERQSTFDFLVQFYRDEAKTPIENPMQEWKEEDSPFIKIATITIPPQVFDSIDRKEVDESLSFNPWHTLPAHEPVGGINLSRRKIYQEIAKARR